jgi:pimeloyl-ACP methyl ester carboxylesterase
LRCSIRLQTTRAVGQGAHPGRKRFGLSRSAHIPPLLGSVVCPTLLIHGGNDRTTPLVVAETIAARISDERLVVLLGAGHRPDVRSPEIVGVCALVAAGDVRCGQLRSVKPVSRRDGRGETKGGGHMNHLGAETR